MFAQIKKDTTHVAQREAGYDLTAVYEANLYIDSICNYKGGLLPAFLPDECFDWHKSSLWDGGKSSPSSVQSTILELVKNKQALKAILKTNNKRLKITYSRKQDNTTANLKVPLIEKSFYHLIKERYRQLK